jgi:hypothetical protein
MLMQATDNVVAAVGVHWLPTLNYLQAALQCCSAGQMCTHVRQLVVAMNGADPTHYMCFVALCFEVQDTCLSWRQSVDYLVVSRVCGATAFMLAVSIVWCLAHDAYSMQGRAMCCVRVQCLATLRV